ncbi:MAG TPA: glutamate--cysteine ligase, partial [Gammaproteobacteria bacterium]|nr:glutamate--cysteine ligase [Gammaproteobacteria bacterium]
QQIEKIKVSGLTPSARILDGVAASGSFAEFSLQRAKALHQSLLEQPLPADMLQALNAEAAASLATQKHLEQEQQDPFPVFLTRYLDL